MTQIKGIDVSHHQGSIDWKKVKADGVQFAFIKATQGVGYKFVDFFRNNAPVALGNEVNTGAYHYATFSTVPEAVAEAKYFVSVIKDFKLTYPLVCDLEENKKKVSRKQLTDALIAFLEYLENAGYFAMWYTYDDFLDTQLDESRLVPYAGWCAHYGGSLVNKADIWQYSRNGRVNGISGDVDMNWSYRDFAAEISNKNKPAPKVTTNGQIGVVTATMHTVVRTGPNAAYPVVQKDGKGLTIEKGQAFKCYDQKDGWYNVGAGWVYSKCSTFKPL